MLLRARADCDEAIAFAEDAGLDVGVLREFLTQAARSSGVESPWTTHSGASNDHSGTPTDSQETGGDVDADESSDDSRCKTPKSQTNETTGDRNVDKYAYDPRITEETSSHTNGTVLDGEVNKHAHDAHSTRQNSPTAGLHKPRAFDTTDIVQRSDSSLEQSSSIRALFRMLPGLKIRDSAGQTGELGLTTLYTPVHGADRATADIVFIHGIGDGPRETWTFNGDRSTFWPLEWLPKGLQFRDTNIHTFGYQLDPKPGSLHINIDDATFSLIKQTGKLHEVHHIALHSRKRLY
jgi:hypothetical protein